MALSEAADTPRSAVQRQHSSFGRSSREGCSKHAFCWQSLPKAGVPRRLAGCGHGACSCVVCGCHAQELGLANEWVSELIFTSLFVSFVLWSFSPFVFPKKRFYTAVLYARFLTALVGAQNSPLRCMQY